MEYRLNKTLTEKVKKGANVLLGITVGVGLDALLFTYGPDSVSLFEVLFVSGGGYYLGSNMLDYSIETYQNRRLRAEQKKLKEKISSFRNYQV